MKNLTNHDRLIIKNDKHLTVETHKVVLNHPLHWHNFFEIEIILSGGGKYIINEIEYDLSQKNVFLLTPTDFHYINGTDEITLINLSFDETVINAREISELFSNKTKKAYHFECSELKRLINAAELLENECKIDGNCQTQLLQYVINFILRDNGSYFSTLTQNHSQEIMKAIIYLEMHFKENITLENLANEVGYNPSYFSDFFKKVTGETYIEKLTKLRIGYARTLLANGFSVSDACFHSGFGSLSNFLTMFKKHCRITPSEYRKKHLNNN